MSSSVHQSMTSSCLFNRGTRKRSHKVHSVQTHTFCTTLVNKDRTFYKSVGGWITSVKRNFWLHAICACTEQHFAYEIRWENWWFGLRGFGI